MNNKNLVRSAKAQYVPVRIRVTDNDIAEGNAGEPNSCPIARSLKRVTLGGTSVSVMGETITLCRNGKRYTRKAPNWVSRFVNSFDADGSWGVDPTRQTVNLPKPVLKRSNR